jgi:hypothetical protein
MKPEDNGISGIRTVCEGQMGEGGAQRLVRLGDGREQVGKVSSHPICHVRAINNG